jgi:hypothetical protein
VPPQSLRLKRRSVQVAQYRDQRRTPQRTSSHTALFCWVLSRHSEHEDHGLRPPLWINCVARDFSTTNRRCPRLLWIRTEIEGQKHANNSLGLGEVGKPRDKGAWGPIGNGGPIGGMEVNREEPGSTPSSEAPASMANAIRSVAWKLPRLS